MKATHLTLLFLLLLPILASAVSHRGPLAGGWTPIKDIKDPHVKEIAEFAVSEHNKSAKTSLKFEKVVRGETQVVSGTNYRLFIYTSDGTNCSGHYQAVVWEKPWVHSRKLISFIPANSG